MEFPFNVARTVGLRSRNGIVCLTSSSFSNTVGNSSSSNNANLHQLIEEIGKASARAQGLKQPVTEPWRLKSNTDQKLYLMVIDGVKAVGILKIGIKKLFVMSPMSEYPITRRSRSIEWEREERSKTGGVKEINALCVLDFYISEQYQRQKYGHKLFRYMLDVENINASHLAYDRPSVRLLKFLEKHYSLRSYTPQNNNFVVYHKYFTDEPRSKNDNNTSPPIAPVPLEEDSLPSREKFSGILHGKYEFYDNNNLDSSDKINGDIVSSSIMEDDEVALRARLFQESVSRATQHQQTISSQLEQQAQGTTTTINNPGIPNSNNGANGAITSRRVSICSEEPTMHTYENSTTTTTIDALDACKNYPTQKQAVDAEVRRLKEKHPTFNRSNSADISAAAAGVLGQQSFTRPSYLQSRERHYSGTGVAGLLGGGSNSTVVAGAGAAGGGGGRNKSSIFGGTITGKVNHCKMGFSQSIPRDGLTRDAIKNAHTRRGPIL